FSRAPGACTETALVCTARILLSAVRASAKPEHQCGPRIKGDSMQFHHHGYVSGEPRVLPAAGTGIDRPAELPNDVDVLIVGSGPAGMLLAAQMSQYPDVTTRIIERRDGRLVLGQ